MNFEIFISRTTLSHPSDQTLTQKLIDYFFLNQTLFLSNVKLIMQVKRKNKGGRK